MTEFDRHEPGTFCWVELATSDFPAAREFYTKLFGWQGWDAPLPDGGVYTMFGIGDRYVGAGTQQQDEERSQGIPPHWNAYVCTDDAEKTAEAAEAAGGTVLAAPFDVLESGRMTVMADPTGGVISAWQAKDHPGFGLADVPGSFGWAELWTPDTARAQAFYEDVFGWTSRTMDMGGGPYTVFSKGERPVGGLMAPQPGTEIPPNWAIYFEVTDVDATVAAAQEGGGSVMMPATSMEGAGRYAVLADPQGAVFGIVKGADASKEG